MTNSAQLINAPAEVQTFQESCDYMRTLEEDVQTCMATIREKGKEIILLRFRQGQVALRTIEMREGGHYGEAVVKELSTRAGMHYSTLYRAMQFARHEQFGGSEVRLQQWITEKEEDKGSVSWTYCMNWTKKHLPDEKDDAEQQLEEQKDRLERKAQALERRAREVEQEAEDLRQETERWNKEAEVTDEASGVAVKAREVASDLRRQADCFEIKGDGRFISSKYIEYVREHECLVCGAERVDAHHITTGGMATKGHDFYAIPLCREHHQETHQNGLPHLWREHRINPWQEVTHLVVAFFITLQ